MHASKAQVGLCNRPTYKFSLWFSGMYSRLRTAHRRGRKSFHAVQQSVANRSLLVGLSSDLRAVQITRQHADRANRRVVWMAFYWCKSSVHRLSLLFSENTPVLPNIVSRIATVINRAYKRTVLTIQVMSTRSAVGWSATLHVCLSGVLWQHGWSDLDAVWGGRSAKDWSK